MNHKNEEKRIFSKCEIEVREADGKPTQIRGIAAVFNSDSENLGGFIERIDPGAFDNVLDDDVRATIDHEGGLQTLGRTRNNTLTLEQTERGLEYVITPPDTRAAKDLIVLIRGGFIDQSSFAFRLKKGGDKLETKDGKVIRTILKGGIARLYDISPVTYPAYPDTSVAVRSFQQWTEENKTATDAEIKAASAVRERQIKLANAG